MKAITFDGIRNLVGEQGMAQFIREAIERELKRREREAR